MRIPILAATVALVLSSQSSASAADCPSAVTAAALEAHAGATVASCKPEREDGKTHYEVKLTTYHRQEIELDISPDGDILVTEADVELGEVPQAVMTAFHAKYAGVKPRRAEKQIASDGKVTYELKLAGGAKKREATFTAEGDFVEEE